MAGEGSYVFARIRATHIHNDTSRSAALGKLGEKVTEVMARANFPSYKAFVVGNDLVIATTHYDPNTRGSITARLEKTVERFSDESSAPTGSYRLTYEELSAQPSSPRAAAASTQPAPSAQPVPAPATTPAATAQPGDIYQRAKAFSATLSPLARDINALLTPSAANTTLRSRVQELGLTDLVSAPEEQVVARLTRVYAETHKSEVERLDSLHTDMVAYANFVRQAPSESVRRAMQAEKDKTETEYGTLNRERAHYIAEGKAAVENYRKLPEVHLLRRVSGIPKDELSLPVTIAIEEGRESYRLRVILPFKEKDSSLGKALLSGAQVQELTKIDKSPVLKKDTEIGLVGYDLTIPRSGPDIFATQANLLRALPRLFKDSVFSSIGMSYDVTTMFKPYTPHHAPAPYTHPAPERHTALAQPPITTPAHSSSPRKIIGSTELTSAIAERMVEIAQGNGQTMKVAAIVDTLISQGFSKTAIQDTLRRMPELDHVEVDGAQYKVYRTGGIKGPTVKWGISRLA